MFSPAGGFPPIDKVLRIGMFKEGSSVGAAGAPISEGAPMSSHASLSAFIRVARSALPYGTPALSSAAYTRMAAKPVFDGASSAPPTPPSTVATAGNATAGGKLQKSQVEAGVSAAASSAAIPPDSGTKEK